MLETAKSENEEPLSFSELLLRMRQADGYEKEEKEEEEEEEQEKKRRRRNWKLLASKIGVTGKL